MKTLFQCTLLLGMLNILFDLAACNRERIETGVFYIEGQLVDVMTRQPVQDVTVEMTALNNQEAFSTLADNGGNFRLKVNNHENQDYIIKIRDADYRIVNPNTQVSPQSSQKIWYLIPTGHR